MSAYKQSVWNQLLPPNQENFRSFIDGLIGDNYKNPEWYGVNNCRGAATTIKNIYSAKGVYHNSDEVINDLAKIKAQLTAIYNVWDKSSGTKNNLKTYITPQIGVTVKDDTDEIGDVANAFKEILSALKYKAMYLDYNSVQQNDYASTNYDEYGNIVGGTDRNARNLGNLYGKLRAAIDAVSRDYSLNVAPIFTAQTTTNTIQQTIKELQNLQYKYPDQAGEDENVQAILNALNGVKTNIAQSEDKYRAGQAAATARASQQRTASAKQRQSRLQGLAMDESKKLNEAVSDPSLQTDIQDAYKLLMQWAERYEKAKQYTQEYVNQHKANYDRYNTVQKNNTQLTQGNAEYEALKQANANQQTRLNQNIAKNSNTANVAYGAAGQNNIRYRAAYNGSGWATDKMVNKGVQGMNGQDYKGSAVNGYMNTLGENTHRNINIMMSLMERMESKYLGLIRENTLDEIEADQLDYSGYQQYKNQNAGPQIDKSQMINLLVQQGVISNPRISDENLFNELCGLAEYYQEKTREAESYKSQVDKMAIGQNGQYTNQDGSFNQEQFNTDMQGMENAYNQRYGEIGADGQRTGGDLAQQQQLQADLAQQSRAVATDKAWNDMSVAGNNGRRAGKNYDRAADLLAGSITVQTDPATGELTYSHNGGAAPIKPNEVAKTLRQIANNLGLQRGMTYTDPSDKSKTLTADQYVLRLIQAKSNMGKGASSYQQQPATQEVAENVKRNMSEITSLMERINNPDRRGMLF